MSKHERRVVGHVSGWQEQMNTCVCGKPWPCAELSSTETQVSRDRPTDAPGGCECLNCGCIFVGAESHEYCAVCEQNRNENAYERSLSECFRGREYASAVAHEMAEARKLK